MQNHKRALVLTSFMALLAATPAFGAEQAPAPAEPPSTPPSGLPGGFPVLAIPVVIVIGAAVALSTDDNTAEPFSGTATGTR